MRLLYVSADPGVPVLGHKGASVHLRELASALSALGVEVAIASPRTEPAGDSLDAAIELLPMPRVASESSEPVLREALEAQRATLLEIASNFKAEAVYERYSLFSDAGVQAAATLRIPHVLEVNAPLRQEATRFRSLPFPALAAEIERDVHRRTGRLLVVSGALKRWLQAEGVEAARVDIVPNAVAPERFPPPIRRNDRSFVVGFCGSLKAWHGIDVLVEACAHALAEEPSLRLEVVGDGPLAHLLRDRRLPASRMRAYGALPHARAIECLSGWDAGIAPYLPLDDFYFSPLKVLEYMAAGTCVVASALGDIPTLLGNGDRGVLVPAGDAAGLAGVLVALARDRELAVDLGHRARSYVLEVYTWERNARLVLDALRKLPTEIAA